MMIMTEAPSLKVFRAPMKESPAKFPEIPLGLALAIGGPRRRSLKHLQFRECRLRHACLIFVELDNPELSEIGHAHAQGSRVRASVVKEEAVELDSLQ